MGKAKPWKKTGEHVKNRTGFFFKAKVTNHMKG